MEKIVIKPNEEFEKYLKSYILGGKLHLHILRDDGIIIDCICFKYSYSENLFTFINIQMHEVDTIHDDDSIVHNGIYGHKDSEITSNSLLQELRRISNIAKLTYTISSNHEESGRR